jgi:hypothetical protein
MSALGACLGLLANAPAIVPALVDSVHMVERLFGKGNGATKKQAVMNIAGDLLNTYAKAAPEFGLTGAGTSEVNAAMGNLVEAIVVFYNAAGLFSHTQKSILPSPPAKP